MSPSRVKKSQQWQNTSLSGFRLGSNQSRKHNKLMERQNSYMSTTTATSSSTHTDLSDMNLEPQSDDSILEEENQNLVQNLKIQSPPKTPATVSADESLISFDDDKTVTSENAFLKRLDATVEDSKPEVYCDNDSDVESEETGKYSIISDIQTPASPSDLVTENCLTDDSANSSLSSNTTIETAAVGAAKTESVAPSAVEDESAVSTIAKSETQKEGRIINSASQILEKYVFGGLAMSLTTFVTIGSVTRPTVEAEAPEIQAVPSLESVPSLGSVPSLMSHQSAEDGCANDLKPIDEARDCEIAITKLNDDDAEDTIFADEDLESSPISAPAAPLSPESERNIRQLHFLSPPSSDIKSLDVLSNGPTLDICPFPRKTELDEEAQLAVALDSNQAVVLLQDAFQIPNSRETSDLAGGSAMGNGSDDPDGSNESSVETAAAMKKKPVAAEGAASPVRSRKMVCFVVAFAAIVAGTLLFVVDTTSSASAAIATASPSVSMMPSTTPSLSQVPSDMPSLTPSSNPSLSLVPSSAPSDHPTGSMAPSMVPSISNAPSLEPSIAPTESMEPSETPSDVPSTYPSSNPSESPSLSPSVSMVPSGQPSSDPTREPSSRPTQRPTLTFQPSRRPTRSPTREPSYEPTDFPTRPPITPPPPVDLANAFKIRLFWNESYFWQESKEETFWCMECVKCEEYGNLDGFDHGCVSHGTGDEKQCAKGDSMWIRDCRGRGNRFNIQGGEENGFMLRIARTDLCIERIKDNHPMLFVQPCDRGSPWQRFQPWANYNQFEIQPIGYRNKPEVESECVSQLHHPKSGELLGLHNCALSRQYETLFWQKY